MSMFGGSSPAGATTTTQTSAPWSGQQQFLSGTGGFTAPNAGGYSAQNPALMQLLGGSLANPGGSTPIQDIARAVGAGQTITDAQWAQAGLPPGGGTVGSQLQAALAGSQGGGTDSGGGSIPGGFNFPQGIPGVLPAAANLYANYTPQYYPGATYAGATPAEMSGINLQESLGANGLPTQGAASNTALGILNPNFTGANPSNATYGNASSGGLNANTGGFFAPLASGQISNTAGTGTLGAIAGGQYANLPGMDELSKIAGGANLSADNPAFKSMVDQIKANVLPTIDAQFASGNRSDSGLASRAEGEGLGSAIGNLAYQNYQQGLQQQQGAAGTLAGLAQGNVGQQAGAAGMLSNIGQANIGNILAGAQGLTGVEQGNNATQLAGAAGQSANYSDALKNQIQAMALAPEFQSMAFGNAGALQQGGAAEQQLNQQAINDAVQRFNYGQQLPYNQLSQYAGTVNGNYGNSSALTQPYFQNQGANILSGALGGGSILSGLNGMMPAGSSFLGQAGAGLAGAGSSIMEMIAPLLAML